MAGPAIQPPRRLAPYFRAPLERPLLAVAAALLVVSLIFFVAPGLDLSASAFFYDSAGGFDEGRYPLLAFVRDTGRTVEKLFAVAVIAPLVLKVLFPSARLLLQPRKTLFVLATLALGPGLVVNAVLKEHWGRARPRALIEFGGDAGFSPVWWISDQCQGNCSFVSGEASSAFWLVALAFIVPKAWRPWTILLTLAFAAAVSFTRVVVGGHFVSDVLIAWLLTLLVMIVLQRAILQRLPPAFDARVEAALARGGSAVRRLWATGDGR